MAVSAVAPSSAQFEIHHGNQIATIVEVGGGIRTYEVGERAVLDPYALDAMFDGAHGAPLIPWPNRLGGGHFRFDEVNYEVALTEPDKSNAIHSFLRWRNWQLAERAKHRVVMTTRLHPLSGYPFTLDVAIAYQLGDEGLPVTTTATNLGECPCPYGCGHHPYVSNFLLAWIQVT
jgi:aldose 1-epimerase